ncbi:S41 family peptidase [Citromicrobium bathyomarinum]|uniref:S41 family peptidase n=1 Tax=Citromicrobium bathyomarinum TaxID=72174 RepID=UPI00315AED4F
MSVGRIALSLVIAGALAACGSDGGGAPTSGTPTPTPGPTPSPTACSVADRQAWVLQQLQTYYLFPDLLDTTVNAANYSDVQSYIDALVAPARALGRDRGFTYITSIQEETDLINSGSSAGFGVRLGYDTVNSRVFVLEAFEGAPAYPQGIDRGTEILSVNGTSTTDLFAQGGAAAFSNALGPSDPGVTRTLSIRQPGGATSTVSVTKQEYALDPISDRYGAITIPNVDGRLVGYLNLRTFIVADAGPQLRTAIDGFRQQGVEQVILDFRYNGGGLVDVAELLGDLLGADKVGDVFSRTVFRDSLSNNNSTEPFEAQPEAIAATKIALIGTSSTASASELTGNAFIPYLGNNLALVGSNTYGKPVGQIARDRTACDDRLRVMAFRTVNADGGGDYYTGLASVFPNTCAADDDFLHQFGSTDEDSTATALSFLSGGTCTPIAASGAKRAASRQRIEALNPVKPTAAQYQIPGLY